MAFNQKQTIRQPHFEVENWLTEEQIKEIKVYLTSNLNTYLNAVGHKEWLSLSSLVGGENENWPDPIIYVYNAYLAHDPNNAVKNAARDMGWILKSIINDDERIFETKKEYKGRKYVRIYRWL